MSISSLSVKNLPAGALFFVRWNAEGPQRALWRRLRGLKIACLLNSVNALNPTVSKVSEEWGDDVTLEPLTDDESARVTALLALGRGELI